MKSHDDDFEADYDGKNFLQVKFCKIVDRNSSVTVELTTARKNLTLDDLFAKAEKLIKKGEKKQ